MKHFYKFMLLVVALFVTSLSASGDEHFHSDGISHDFESDGIFYNITDSVSMTVEVTYRGDDIYEYAGEYSGDVIIPQTVTYEGVDYTVTGIGRRAFSGCPDLLSIFVPCTVTEIDMPILSYYRSLASIVVDERNAVYDSRENCNAIIETSQNRLVAGCKTTVIPSSVTVVGNFAFHACLELASAVIPGSVCEIGDSAFFDCYGLTSIDIPDSVKKIGCSAFESIQVLSLTSFSLGNSIEVIGDYAFRGVPLSSLELSNVTYIGKSAFEKCGLESLCLGNSLVEIGQRAFMDNLLSYVTIPDSVKKIGSEAFVSCPLREITIGKSVEEIGTKAFYCSRGGRNYLTSVTSLNRIPPVCGRSSFSGVSTCRLDVPAGTKETYSAANVWGSFGNIVEIATVEVSTQESRATFEIPATEGSALYTVDVYSDEAMTQLVASSDYDATGTIIPMSTSLELSIENLDNGVYYYSVVVKSSAGETLGSYSGTFEIVSAGIDSISGVDNVVETGRYDIYGHLISEPVRGINIVVYSDGAVRKVIVE